MSTAEIVDTTQRTCTPRPIIAMRFSEAEAATGALASALLLDGALQKLEQALVRLLRIVEARR